MPHARPRRPVRIFDPFAAERAARRAEAQRRHDARIAFRDAVCKQAWATAYSIGSRRCGSPEFDAAELAVIASGHAKPPADWGPC